MVKRTSPDIHNDIRDAVEQLPRLLSKPNNHHAVSSEYLAVQRKRRRWLWSIVTPLSVLVFFMWFLNAKGVAGNLLGNQSQETTIVSNIRNDFTAVLAAIDEQEQKTELEAAVQKEYGEGVRDELQEIFQTLFVATTGTASDPAAPTSTVAAVTSTEE